MGTGEGGRGRMDRAQVNPLVPDTTSEVHMYITLSFCTEHIRLVQIKSTSTAYVDTYIHTYIHDRTTQYAHNTVVCCPTYM